MSFSIRFHGDIPHSRRLQTECEELSGQLQEEFPEAHKFEVSVRKNGDQYESHVHVSGGCARRPWMPSEPSTIS